MGSRWVPVADLLRLHAAREAVELTRREEVLAEMERDPADRKGPGRGEPDAMEFLDHGPDDPRRPKGWLPDA